jgi:hypothetical protein
VKRTPIVMPYIYAALALTCAACSATDSTGLNAVVTTGDTVSMSGAPGALIAHDSLTLADNGPLPCCTRDSAGIHIQVTAGTMTFYAATIYADMAGTPEGPKPHACVQEVPNGWTVGINNVLTFTDGASYLLMPCTAGFYSITLTERLSLSDGSSTNRQVVVSSGRYGWQRDLLSLREQGNVSHAAASMSGATISVAVPGHRYTFLALPREP